VTVTTWTPVTFPRDEFASTRFDYQPGEHVLFAGPSQQAGKTTLAFKLLEYHATPEFPAWVIVSKPKDPVTSREGARLGFRRVDTWPVERKVQELWDGKPRGYLIWPHFGDIDTDAERASRVSAAVFRDRYAAGVKGDKGIIVADDTVVKSKLLGLDRYMTTHLAMAGAMDVGGWYFVQKPTGSGQAALWSYGNSSHTFLSRDKDRRNRIRYDEIGGVDRGLVGEITQNLKPFQFLYLNGKGEMCIVDSK
jgi:hypothetical protein